MVTQWIAWIQLFDFEVWQVPGHNYSANDCFSYRLSTATNLAEAEGKTDIDDFILTEFNSLWVSPIFLHKQIPIFMVGNSDYSSKNDIYVTTL